MEKKKTEPQNKNKNRKRSGYIANGMFVAYSLGVFLSCHSILLIFFFFYFLRNNISSNQFHRLS